ncbi:MAG TPA: hypothetical protein VIK55_14240 [Paludibacter sp.]
MERIKIFTINKGLTKFFIISGIVCFVSGISLLTYSLINGFKIEFIGGDWSYVIFTIEGILFFLLGYSNLIYGKYFIEWNDEELKYLLPKNKHAETIKISDIEAIEIKLFEISIQLPGSNKKLNLENVRFKELKSIKTKFEEIKRATNLR